MDVAPEAAAPIIRAITSRRLGASHNRDLVSRKKALLRALFPALAAGGQELQTFLISLGQDDRYHLMQAAEPETRIKLAAGLGDLDGGVSPPQLRILIPSDLPDDLRRGLTDYLDKHRRRLDLLVKNGHARSPKFLQKKLQEPIRLAKFISAQGLSRWMELSSSTLVAFAKQYPSHNRVMLKAFLDHIRDQDRFRKKPGPPKKKPAQVLRSSRMPDVYRPDALAEKLKQARQRLPAEEYVLYWMVARLGMTALAACRITLDRLHVNTDGQMVIRPADGWVQVPKSVAPTLARLAKAAAPGWPFEAPESGGAIPFMAPVADSPRKAALICDNETRKLRLSAAYAAIRAGHHDRSTLRAFMGISLKILEQLEFLLQADMHMIVDPDIVKRRNAVILGKADA